MPLTSPARLLPRERPTVRSALNAIRAYLDPGESAVGTAVNVRHLAATPVGRLVTGEAEVTKVDGRQIEFTVRAIEGTKEIGAGSIPGSSSTWLNLPSGSDEKRSTRLTGYPGNDEFGPGSKPGRLRLWHGLDSRLIRATLRPWPPCLRQEIVTPLSTGRIWPVTMRDSSLAR